MVQAAVEHVPVDEDWLLRADCFDPCGLAGMVQSATKHNMSMVQSHEATLRQVLN